MDMQNYSWYMAFLITNPITGATLLTIGSTAQLSSKVTFERIWNVCETHLKRVQDASGMRRRCICASTKPCDKTAVRRTRLGCMQTLPWSWAVPYVSSHGQIQQSCLYKKSSSLPYVMLAWVIGHHSAQAISLHSKYQLQPLAWVYVPVV